MKKTVLKDFNSILQLCQGNPPQQAIDLILNCKQTNEYGCMLTSNDEVTGHHVMYSVHFVFHFHFIIIVCKRTLFQQ